MEVDNSIAELVDYTRQIRGAKTEAERRDLFSTLLRELLGNFAQFQNIRLERSVRSEGLFIGRVDLSLDGVIVEFKKDISSRPLKVKALQELRKYFNTDEYKKASFGIITDGIKFEVYSREDLEKPIDVFSLPESEENIKEMRYILHKIDRYFLTPQKVPLTSDRVIDILGYNSQVFQTVKRMLSEAFSKIRENKDVKLKFLQWSKYMNFVYGSEVEEDLFFRHTYLSIVVKLLAIRILNLIPTNSIEEILVEEILSGKFFERRGIMNYIENDFYGWIFNEKIRQEIQDISFTIFDVIQKKFLLEHLSDEIEEDLLKELYQNIVSKEERQMLGEYYTPDWLVQEILKDIIKDPGARVLDPACGSGSFLFFAIKMKKAVYFKNIDGKLKFITNTVIGFDINPIAVLIARTNYLIALGDLLKNRSMTITLPVYTSDSLMSLIKGVKNKFFGSEVRITIDDKEIILPKNDNVSLIDRFIDVVIEYAINGKGQNFYQYILFNYPDVKDNLLSLWGDKRFLEYTVNVVYELIKYKRDTIWAFVLKNIYKPLLLRGQFDIVVGNPPWMAYNKMPPNLQKFVEEYIKDLDIKVDGHNKSHIELALIFLISSFLNYLRDDGIIAFVLPYSVITGDQNEWFRRNYKYKSKILEIDKIYDLKDVSPLFNVPASVVIGKKKNQLSNFNFKGNTNIPVEIFAGKLPKSNVDIEVARKKLTREIKTLYLVEIGGKYRWVYDPSQVGSSIYAQKFKEGATIVPRSFWFVDREKTSLGMSKESIPIRSKNSNDNKIKVIIRGSAPEKFFFMTIPSKRMYPFGYSDVEDVVLPLEFSDTYKLLDYYEIVKRKKFENASGKFRYWIENTKKVPKNFKEWLVRCQRAWEEDKGNEAKSHNIIDWLNYRNKLISQPVRGGYLVIYTASGSNPCACVIENHERFVVDYTTFYAMFKSKEEAFYISAFINSSILANRIKKYQVQGLYGERHITKLIVKQPIPKYDPNNDFHREIVNISRKSHQKANRKEVKDWLKNFHSNTIRGKGRWLLEFDMYRVDYIIAKILGEKEPEFPKRLAIFIEVENKNFISRILKRFIRENRSEFRFKFYPPKILQIKYDLESIKNFSPKYSVEITGDLSNKREMLSSAFKKEGINIYIVEN